MAKPTGAGFFKIDNPSDEVARQRYKKALAEVLVMVETAVKLCVWAKDSTGLQSLKGEVVLMIEKAENTLKYGPAKNRPGNAG